MRLQTVSPTHFVPNGMSIESRESKLRLVCLIPMGLETPSVGPQIAECQKVLEKSGLEYKVGHPLVRYKVHADSTDAVSRHGLDKLGLTIKRLRNKSRRPMG